jgi:hypothetical protein
VRAHISSIAALLCLGCVTAAADEPDKGSMEAIEIPHSAEAKELASVCLTKMYDSLAQPNSGRVKVSFTVGHEPPYCYAITFDKGWELFRCDAEPLPAGIQQGSTPRAAKPEIWIRNKNCLLLQRPWTHVIDSYERDHWVRSIDPLPFDPRLLGVLSNTVEFERMDYTLEIFKKQLSEQALESYASKLKDGGNPIVIEMFKRDRFHWFIWLDPKFHPVKNEMWTWIESKKDWWHQSTMVVRRASFHGVDVPVEAEMFDSSKLRATVHCDWQEVNLPVDPTTFELESLKAEGRTLVVDNRHGEPIIEKVIGTE